MNSPKLSYRAEIDGLRAIAVISVILYHAQMVLFGRDWFEGGFIGVDIFFVISGYLITRIILSELQTKGSFSFLNFYERRARRILPMLFVVIFVSIPYAWQKLLPSDFVEYAESILASLFFGSNFFFYFNTTEYGADSALLKPFLHTWSLGVEEQFYLVFPIIAIVAFKFFRANFLTIIVALSLLSLQFAEIMEVRNSELNFYLPFSRFWELAVGSVLAYRELNYKASEDGFGRRVLPIIGLYLVAFSILFFDGKTPHPSFHTLIPILGVALIIGFSSKDELVGKILGSKPFVWIGLINFSAYLWHFPIFAFSRMGKDPTNNDKFEWILLTFGFSVVSYFLVERGFRNRKTINIKLFMSFVFLSFITICIGGYYVLNSDGFPQRVPPILLKENLSTKAWERYRKGGRLCFDRNVDFCTENEGLDKPTVLFFGDSHFSALSEAVRVDLEGKANYIEANLGGCPFALEVQRRSEDGELDTKNCTPKVQVNRYSAIPSHSSVIVVGGRLPLYFSGQFFDNKEGGVEGGFYRKFEGVDGEEFKIKVKNTWMKLLDEGHRLLIVYPIPNVGWDVPKKLFELSNKFTTADELKDFIESKPITTSSDVFFERSKEAFDFYDSIKHQNVFRVYPHRIFCNTVLKTRCLTHDSENVFYNDDDHPSRVGAQMIVKPLNEEISKAIASLKVVDGFLSPFR